MPKLEGWEVSQLARAYLRGATVRELAEEHDVHESTIRRWLGDVERRQVGPRPLPVADERIVELRDADVPWQEIAVEVGMSRSGVRRRYMAATTGRKRW